jgi:ferredoxin
LKPFHLLLDKQDLAEFLSTILPICGPVGEAEKSRFELLRGEADLFRLNLSLTSTALSPKALFFPQTETISTYDRKTEEEAATLCDKNDPLVVFGLRPCDGRALDALDSHFTQAIGDPNYIRRRENSVLIGIGCNHPGPNCFCPSVGGGPFSTVGLDALLTDIGGEYLVELLTDRGQALFQGKAMLRQASEIDERLKEEAERAALTEFERAFELAGVKERLEADCDGDLWDDIARRCISCGVCAYLCPTCYCFIVYNDELRGSGRRVRTWTSCQLPKLIFQETGVNLRPNRAARIKRRIWDKYKEFPDRFGKVGCMGCGRCIDACPVDLDIVEVITALKGRGLAPSLGEVCLPAFAEARELVPAPGRGKPGKGD